MAFTEMFSAEVSFCVLFYLILLTKCEPRPFARLVSKINSTITNDYNPGFTNEQTCAINSI